MNDNETMKAIESIVKEVCGADLTIVNSELFTSWRDDDEAILILRLVRGSFGPPTVED